MDLRGGVFTLVFLCLVIFVVRAGGFEWEAVRSTDWQVSGDDSLVGDHGAVILFEKIHVNDEKLAGGKIYITLYYRIRILNNEGRSRADVTVPYLDKKQKIEEIRGRTILPRGRIKELDKKQIIEKEIFKAKGVKIKQKSFSLPGVSDDCIIEYYLKYRLPSPPGIWRIQKEVPLLFGQMVWKFYRGRGMDSWIYNMFSKEITPNYMWQNMDKPLEVEHRPSIKKPKEVILTATNVAAFASEPFSEPDLAVQGHLRYYYGSAGAPAAYWGRLSDLSALRVTEFTKKNGKLREIIENFQQLGSRQKKQKAAYAWVQENIENVDYSDSENDFKENNNINDVIKRRYGSSEEINLVYLDMLREMNIPALFAYVVDRDENAFVYHAKYWQFDRSMVAVPRAGLAKYQFHMPGQPHLAYSEIPWYNESVPALLVGSIGEQFQTLPFSAARTNKRTRFQRLSMDSELLLSGKILEKNTGHFAKRIRAELQGQNLDEQHEYFRQHLGDIYAQSTVDSLKVENVTSPGEAIKVTGQLTYEASAQKAGNRMLLELGNFLYDRGNPFLATARKSKIMFEHTFEDLEMVRIAVPEGWTVEAIPEEVHLTNEAGACQVKFSIIDNGKALSVQRLFSIKHIMLQPAALDILRSLYESNSAVQNKTVVLTKAATAASTPVSEE